jgi:hypothetical protein
MEVPFGWDNYGFNPTNRGRYLFGSSTMPLSMSLLSYI